MVVRFETFVEIIGTDKQGEEVQGKDSTMSVLVRVRDDLIRALATYIIITSDKLLNTQKDSKIQWKTIGMNNPKEIKTIGIL